MNQRWLTRLAVPALVAAGLLLCVSPASAQRFFGGRSAGWGNGWGSGYGVGIGTGYYGNGYYGNNWYGSGWNSPYNSGYYGSGWNYPRTSTYGWNGYPNSYYGWNYYPSNYSTAYMPSSYYGYEPSYNYGGMNTAAFNGTQNSGYTSFYSGDNNGMAMGHERHRFNIPDTAALISVRVPQDAKIWFDGEETHERGMFRQFVSPALEKGLFFYNVRAQWTENGQNVDLTRKVLVRPGDQISIDMMRGMTAVEEVTPHLPNNAFEHRSGYENGQQNNTQRETVAPPTDTTNENRNLFNDNLNNNRNTTTPPATTTPTTPTTPRGTAPSSGTGRTTGGTSGTTNPTGGTSSSGTNPSGTGR